MALELGVERVVIIDPEEGLDEINDIPFAIVFVNSEFGLIYNNELRHKNTTKFPNISNT